MSDIKSIKYLRNTKDLTISQIAQIHKVNWRTAKKYADHDQLPSGVPTKRTGMMYQEKWGEIVSDWLFEDSKVRRKLRRTAKTIYQSLQQLGFRGSYRTVCCFIAEWKSLHYIDEERQAYERLEHPPGEAQLDFGLMQVVKDQQYVDTKVLVLSFPYNNTAFAVSLPGENTECFLYGLKELFKEAGGVPTHLRIDNLPAAVIKPKKGTKDAELTDAFLNFQAHYGFEVQTCNPYSGYEKGHVENKVGYIRYNFFVIPSVMTTFKKLNETLMQQLNRDRERLHYQKAVTIETLWQDECKYLKELPKNEYPVFTYKTAKINKFGEITLDKDQYRIPKGIKHKVVTIRKEWDQFTVFSPFGEELYHSPRAYMNQGKPIPWKDILHDWRIKPGSILYSRHYKHLPVRIQSFLQSEDVDIRKARVKELLTLLNRYSMMEINDRFYELTVMNEGHSEPRFEVDWKAYDALTPGGKEI